VPPRKLLERAERLVTEPPVKPQRGRVERVDIGPVTAADDGLRLGCREKLRSPTLSPQELIQP
jgi:hypothetical protein